MADTSCKLEKGFLRLIGMAGRSVRSSLDQNLAQAGYDISAMHMLLLGYLCENEGVNQQTLTECMFRDKTATTRGIDFLEVKDLVVRIPDKTDRRQKLIYLTKKGRRIIGELMQVVWKTEKDALRGIEPKKIAICKEVLKQVRGNLFPLE